MLSISIILFLFIFLLVIVTSSVWSACGKIFKIEKLTFKNALATAIIITIVNVIISILDFLLSFVIISDIYYNLFCEVFGLILGIIGMILVIWIIKKRFETTKLRAAGFLLVQIIFVVGVALFISTFVLRAFTIPAGSMKNTLLVGDDILVSMLYYKFQSPKRS